MLLGDDGGQSRAAVSEPVEEFALRRIGSAVGHGRGAIPKPLHLGVGRRCARVVEHRQQRSRVRVEVRQRPRRVVDDCARLLGHAGFRNVFDGLDEKTVDHRVDVQDRADRVGLAVAGRDRRCAGSTRKEREFKPSKTRAPQVLDPRSQKAPV